MGHFLTSKEVQRNVRRLSKWVLWTYIILAMAALVVAGVRLSGSTEYPGLAAIELIVLALPWSLALSVEPFSRLGLIGMGIIVCGGLVLNGLALTWATSFLQRQSPRVGTGKR